MCFWLPNIGQSKAQNNSNTAIRGVGPVSAAALLFVVQMPMVLSLAITIPILGSLIGRMDVMMNANAAQIEKEIFWPIILIMHGFWSFGWFVGGYLTAYIGALLQQLWICDDCGIAAFCAMPFLFETGRAFIVSLAAQIDFPLTFAFIVLSPFMVAVLGARQVIGDKCSSSTA